MDDFVTQEQLNLRLNTLRYDIGMTIERTVAEQVAKAMQPLESRLNLFATNAETALTDFAKLNAKTDAAIDSRNREIADIHAAIRDIVQDTARGIQGYDLVQDLLKDLKAATEGQHQSVMAMFQKHDAWISKRSAIERAVLSGARIFLPTARNIIVWFGVLLVSSVVAILATLFRLSNGG